MYEFYSRSPPLNLITFIIQANAIMLAQERHEAILRSHLEKHDCFVELGTELKSLEPQPDHVVAHLVLHREGAEVTEDVEFSYLISAEGAHSVVRKSLGWSFLGETTKSQNLVIGDIHVKKGLSNDVSILVFCFY